MKKMDDLPEVSVRNLLDTKTVTVRDVVCHGTCRHQSAEECATSTHLVFPYRGVFVHHVGRDTAVAEANQVLFLNQSQGYRISHPIDGGDSCLSLGLGAPLLNELAPKGQLQPGEAPVFKDHRRRIDSDVQTMVARLRYGLLHQFADTLEAETVAISLVRLALGEGGTSTSPGRSASVGRQKLVDRAKLVLASDPARRWTLADIASEVRVSPVYLTQVFQQVEGMPLYRYQLRLRLARALDLLEGYEDLSRLSLDLGFSSHSHFTSVFRQVYGHTPAQFRQSIHSR